MSIYVAFIAGFFAFPGLVAVVTTAHDFYGDWQEKRRHYQKCPTCGTYVLNFKKPTGAGSASSS